MAGGLRYETGREMPPGMQELYGVKIAGEMRIATAPAEPCNDEKAGGRMPYCGDAPDHEEDKKPNLKTGEYLRSLSNEQLAEIIYKLWKVYAERGVDFSKNWCDGRNKKNGKECYSCNPKKHRACIAWWLDQPMKDDR